MAVRIITDSASDITPEEAESLSSEGAILSVLPLGVTFGDKTYHDGVDLTHRRFFELLVESDELPHTSAVSPYDFGQAFDEAEAVADEVVCVLVGERLSGTLQSARIAARGHAGTICIVDSRSVCVGERVLVELALRLAREGMSAQFIADTIASRAADVCVVGLLDTLEYLVKGGRLPAAAGAIGGMLAIKPVVSIADGAVVLLGTARGSRNGRNLLTEQVERAGGIDFSLPFALGFAGFDDKLLRKYVEDSRALWEGQVAELPIHSVGGTIGTHVGPDCIAVAFFRNR